MPPFEGVALKFTVFPGHIVAEGKAAMVTAGTRPDETIMVITFDVAVAGLTQLAFEVTTH